MVVTFKTVQSSKLKAYPLSMNYKKYKLVVKTIYNEEYSTLYYNSYTYDSFFYPR